MPFAGALATLLATLLALAQAVLGWLAVRSFVKSCRVIDPVPGDLPAVSVLKPLCGDEPGLEQALASFCAQDYPRMQIVFGVQDQSDPAIAVAERVRNAFPALDTVLIVNPGQHGANRKIGNLINMLPSAAHEVLVFADSDLHVQPDYLRRVVAALARPRVGLVTTLSTGRPGIDCVIGRLGALALTCGFLPGVLLGRRLGRQDNLGTTMALRRETLRRAGGLVMLADELADDAALGQSVRALGLGIALAATLPQATVAETRFAALFAHELRWGRTIRALEPTAYALSLLQYPLFWAVLTVLMSGCAAWSLALFGVAWLIRAALAAGICLLLKRVGTPGRMALWLLPVRDLMSAAVVLCSFAGRAVTWRGHTLRAAPPRRTGTIGAGQSLGMIRR